MVLLPMHAAIGAVAPRAAAVMRGGVLANRARWEALQASGDPHAIICGPGDAAAPPLHVFGGQAVDPLFGECARRALSRCRCFVCVRLS